MIEELARGGARHESTEHEDLNRALQKEVRAQVRGERRPPPDPEKVTGVPRDVQESLVLDHHARHYRDWIDQPVPALDGLTPRQAATSNPYCAR